MIFDPCLTSILVKYAPKCHILMKHSACVFDFYGLRTETHLKLKFTGDVAVCIGTRTMFESRVKRKLNNDEKLEIPICVKERGGTSSRYD